MCGIAGIIKKSKEAVASNDIERMLNKIIHRGPDACGIYCDGNYGIGHRRLSILDLSVDGNQPMHSNDDRFVIAFNGEIYNYLELKEQLQELGHRFKTGTDTEVIIAAYSQWGIECTSKFNGMWAFALYDADKKIVFLSRDRFGVKPLYFFENDETIIFASEIKCILELKPEEAQVNETAIARYFRNIEEDSDTETFYKNIKNFIPASNMVIDLNTNHITYTKYWRLNKEKCLNDYKAKNPVRTFLKIFNDAVKIRLRSDVPVGASLSGGLDSSAIVSVISKENHKVVNTFSSIYSQKECNEEEFISCVNKDSGTIPHYIYPDTNENVIEDLEQLIYFHDGPLEGASPYSGYCVYRGVGNKVTVMLDGQGADEIFAGYQNDVASRVEDLINKNTILSKIKAAALTGKYQTAIPQYAYVIPEQQLMKILGSYGYYLYTKNKAWDNPRKNCMLNGIFTDAFERTDTNCNWEYPKGVNSEFDKLLYSQLFYSRLPRILHDVDRNSMASSLEVRLPFLDYRLVEFSYSLDADWKLNGSWSKYIMRKSLKKYLPKKIYSRRNKMGFPAPFDSWLRSDKYRDRIKQLIYDFGNRNIVEKEKCIAIYNSHLAGNNMEGLLFKMFCMEMWLEKYIDKKDFKWKLGECI